MTEVKAGISNQPSPAENSDEVPLSESEARFRLVLEASPDGFIILRSVRDASRTIADFQIEYTNPVAATGVNRTAQELLGQYLLHLFPDCKTSGIFDRYVTVAETGISTTFETFYDSKELTGWFRNVVVKLNDGIAVSFSNITDRKQAELALQQQEQHFRVALQTAKLGSWEHDLTTGVLTCSAQCKANFGLSPDAEFTHDTLFAALHPDDRPVVEAAIARSVKERRDYEVEERCYHPDGSLHWLIVRGQIVYDSKGTPIRMVGVTLDITEQKQFEESLRAANQRISDILESITDGFVAFDRQENVEGFVALVNDITHRKLAEAALRQSEERYRYLAESIPQLVWTADAEGVLIDTNQRWSNFTGLTLAQAETEGWQAIVHPDDVHTLSQNWAIAQRDGTYYQAEGRIRRADGVYRWHLHQAVPLKNERGESIKWFGTATDIEDQKQLEQQRIHLLQQEQAAREQAETANRIKDEFLAVLSHELRSPLNPILGWAKLLQTRQFDESGTKRALEAIERNAKLQTQLIDDLLDVSRILRGKMVLSVSQVNLAGVIDAALETVRLSAEAKGIEIRKVVAGDIRPVSGDSSRLQQIVWNLLSNAVKFTPYGGKIAIRLEQVGTDAQIQVKDTGIGITSEFLPHVFEYFRQEDSATTRRFGGLGLGLAIVRYLTELHGGTVKAESPGVGLGATFTVSLPLLKQENGGKTYGAVSASAVANTPLLPNVRILVVDDEADMRELILTVLEQTGAEIKVAASAVEGLEAFALFKPDVLMCDIGMPETDGYEVIRQVRSLPPEQGGGIPAIALTAYAAESDRQQALAAGFQKHIAKPVEPEALVEAIVNLVMK